MEFPLGTRQGYYCEIRTILEREEHWDVGELMRLDATDGTVFWRMETRSCWAEERGQDDTSNTHRVQKASEQHTTSIFTRRALCPPQADP